MKRILIILLMMVASNVFCQTRYSDSTADYENMFQDMVFDSSAYALEDAIKDAGQRHAIYSYNLVNATTPGFKPYLFADDKQELDNIAPNDMSHFSKVLVEHMTTKMAENSKRQSAYYALYRKKMDNYRMVVTFGKK